MAKAAKNTSQGVVARLGASTGKVMDEAHVVSRHPLRHDFDGAFRRVGFTTYALQQP